MNDKELDRLFCQKLDSMEATPSAGAWQQLEAGLQRKKQKQKKLWAYVSGIAAALLLLLGTWGAFEYSQQLLPARELTETNSQPGTPGTAASAHQEQDLAQSKHTPEPEEAETIMELAENKTKAVAAEQPAFEKTEEKKQNLPPGKERQPQALATSDPQDQQAQTERLPVASVEGKALESQTLAINEMPKTLEEQLPLKEKVVISYRADEEPEAAMAIASADIEAAPAREKEISARKILGFFKKVTDNSATGLTELREAKNELLSLNRLSRPE